MANACFVMAGVWDGVAALWHGAAVAQAGMADVQTNVTDACNVLSPIWANVVAVCTGTMTGAWVGETHVWTNYYHTNFHWHLEDTQFL